VIGVVYEKLFIYFIPRMLGAWSLVFHRLVYKGFVIGKNAKCWGSVLIAKTPGSFIAIGDDAHIVSDVLRAGIATYSKLKLQAFNNAKIIIGDGVGLIGTSITCRTTSIDVDNGTIIGPNVIIVDSDFHRIWPPQDRTHNMGYENDKCVKICKNVWIGMNSLVLKGVTIGENSIIAAGSVVVRDIPANVVAGGNPAKVIKKLS